MAYSVLNTMLEEQDRIFLEPAPYIGLTDLADSSVNITLRAWVSSGDFFYGKTVLNRTCL